MDLNAPLPLGGGLSDPFSVAVALRDRDMVQVVRDAIQRNDALLALQPIVHAKHTHKVAFHEGLIRVRDATGRIIPAQDFIGKVEDTEYGRLLDCRSLELGLATLRDAPDLRLSVNMSARSIGYRPWIDTLHRQLHNSPDLAQRLILEISERSAMAAPDVVTGFMDDLHMRGVSFALDDFGAGLISFSHLRDLFFDFVKIDGQFAQGIHCNSNNQTLVKALISVASEFEMHTVAEQVNDPADAAYLISAGVDCLQGYAFGVPSLRMAGKGPALIQSA